MNDHDRHGPIAYDAADAIALGRGYRAHALSAGGEAAHAYLISRAEAARRLERGIPARGPADVYDVLPYRPRFLALTGRKGAYLSPLGYGSSIGARRDDPARVPLRRLRRWPCFYRLRDWLRCDLSRKQRVIDRIVADGGLPAGHDWKAMPSGLHVLFD